MKKLVDELRAEGTDNNVCSGAEFIMRMQNAAAAAAAIRSRVGDEQYFCVKRKREK